MAILRKLARYREMLQLHKHFRTYFQVIPAVSGELIREAQMIRHDVYSCELGWEPVCNDGLEKDVHDGQALHCLLKAVRSNRYIGCVRLVLPQLENLATAIPLQQVCAGKLDEGHPDAAAIAHEEVAEVSRLAIVADYRRRKHEQGRPMAIVEDDYNQQGRRRFPYIPVGLYIGMLHLASYHGIKTLYILTEPLLASHFSRLGGNLRPVGEAIEHHGKRKPYVMDVDLVLKKSHPMLRPLIWTIGRDVRRQLNG
ncbi:MAG: PEP-CTERM/exosortase system-associated acyltransferase [Thermodesulfobacteriota bacterium]|nr:PEP-CTERM/exosortase system-associated acyltransferase [Thermodesulfobacteriota bacterium]